MRYLALSSLLLLTAQAVVAQDWKETKSTQGNFKVKLPGESRSLSREIDTAAGKLKIHMFLVEQDQGNTAFMVMYSDYPDGVFEQKTVENILDDAAEGAVSNVNGKLQSAEPIKHKTMPGRDLEATSTAKGQTTYLSWRLLIHENRMYQIGCVKVGEKMPADVVKKVRESFQILR